MKRRWIRRAVQVAISIGILLFLLSRVSLSEFAVQFYHLDSVVIAWLVVMLPVTLLIRSWRFKLLFDTSTQRISLGESFILLLVGLGLNLTLPASSGDVAKSYFGFRWSGIKERMLSTSVLDKVIAVSSVTFVGLPFSIYCRDILFTMLFLGALLPSLLILILPLAAQRYDTTKCALKWLSALLRNRIDFVRVVEELKVGTRKWIAAILWSVLGWVMTYIIVYLCFRATSSHLSLGYVLATGPLLTIVRLFPFTINGLGSDEAVWIVAFARVGVDTSASLAASLFFRFVALIGPGVVGLIFLACVKGFRAGRDT